MKDTQTSSSDNQYDNTFVMIGRKFSDKKDHILFTDLYNNSLKEHLYVNPIVNKDSKKKFYFGHNNKINSAIDNMNKLSEENNSDIRNKIYTIVENKTSGSKISIDNIGLEKSTEAYNNVVDDLPTSCCIDDKNRSTLQKIVKQLFFDTNLPIKDILSHTNNEDSAVIKNYYSHVTSNKLENIDQNFFRIFLTQDIFHLILSLKHILKHDKNVDSKTFNLYKEFVKNHCSIEISYKNLIPSSSNKSLLKNYYIAPFTSSLIGNVDEVLKYNCTTFSDIGYMGRIDEGQTVNNLYEIVMNDDFMDKLLSENSDLYKNVSNNNTLLWESSKRYYEQHIESGRRFFIEDCNIINTENFNNENTYPHIFMRLAVKKYFNEDYKIYNIFQRYSKIHILENTESLYDKGHTDNEVTNAIIDNHIRNFRNISDSNELPHKLPTYINMAERQMNLLDNPHSRLLNINKVLEKLVTYGVIDSRCGKHRDKYILCQFHNAVTSFYIPQIKMFNNCVLDNYCTKYNIEKNTIEPHDIEVLSYKYAISKAISLNHNFNGPFGSTLNLILGREPMFKANRHQKFLTNSIIVYHLRYFDKECQKERKRINTYLEKYAKSVCVNNDINKTKLPLRITTRLNTTANKRLLSILHEFYKLLEMAETENNKSGEKVVEFENVKSSIAIPVIFNNRTKISDINVVNILINSGIVDRISGKLYLQKFISRDSFPYFSDNDSQYYKMPRLELYRLMLRLLEENINIYRNIQNKGARLSFSLVFKDRKFINRLKLFGYTKNSVFNNLHYDIQDFDSVKQLVDSGEI